MAVIIYHFKFIAILIHTFHFHLTVDINVGRKQIDECNVRNINNNQSMFQPKLQLKLPNRLTLQHFGQSIQIETQIKPKDNLPQNNPTITNKLRALASTDGQIYPLSFVSDFLLMKINSLLKYSSPTLTPFLSCLSEFYNILQNQSTLKFYKSHHDGELMAQIILQSQAQIYLNEQIFSEVLEGSALVLSTMIYCIRTIQKLLKKSEYVVVLGLVSLHARTNPFISIVHQQKNHKGQIDFAAKINDLIHLNPNVQKPNLDIVQDAYSLRCTPQVHGVVYDCLEQIKNQLSLSLNKPQGENIYINGKKQRNLLQRSQTQALMLDSLICSMNQIGHMSFLRTERILNRQLGKNNIHLSAHYNFLTIQMKKISYFISQNKAISSPTNTDTILMDNYSHDIFYDDGLHFWKALKMTQNLQKILKIEVMTSIEVIYDLYSKNPQLFQNPQMQKIYLTLLSLRCSTNCLQSSDRINSWLSQQ